LVLGLGAGGFDHEFSAFGLPVRTPGRKIAAQRDAIAIIRGLWSQETTTYAGSEFTTRDARIDPLPAHPIPIWLGSYGPRALALTGQLADGWVPSFGRVSLAQATAMRDVVRKSARAAGRDPDSITCACNLRIGIDPSQTPTPEHIVGSPTAITQQLIHIVEAGFTFLLLSSPTVSEQEFLARDVIPHVRAAIEARGIVDLR
jgi:alkanesulfonate monooxygenase SsuD/methylene tetrahydromethanopterin reductase-like flavin-dependent oxidoreductase (luciferase family)